MSSKTNNIGIVAILIKLGPKLISVFLKTAKSATILKTASVAASLGAYSLIFSWQMAFSLVAFILIHEYGHLLAMKKCGLKTKGIYLIPFFGGAAIAGERFKTARNEAFIAVGGPLMGCVFIVPMIVLYFLTNQPIFAAIASTMALINLLNLFPINPLDGGRMVKSFFYSFRNSTGFSFAMLSVFVAILFGMVTKFHLLMLVAIIGLMEVVNDYGLQESFKELIKTFLRILGMSLMWWIFSSFHGTSGKGFVIILKFLLIFIIAFLFFCDLYNKTVQRKKPFWSYPWIMIRDLLVGIHKLFLIDYKSLKVIDGYVPMEKKQIIFYSFAYMGTIILMIALVWFPSYIPGCDLAKEMLK